MKSRTAWSPIWRRASSCSQETPTSGTVEKTSHVTKRVLFWSVGPTLIAYRSNPEWVEVLFVERGDIDWERMLTERLE